MTAKKKTTTKRAARTIEDRARAIVGDAQKYDAETRNALRVALRRGDEDLAECVRRAEDGETIMDIGNAAASTRKLARQVADFCDARGIPSYISLAPLAAIEAASERTGIPHWLESGAGWDINGLARLIAATSGTNFTLELEPKKDLAELLSAVLTHPDCPTELYNAVADCDCMTPSRWDTPEHIRLALASHRPKGGE